MKTPIVVIEEKTDKMILSRLLPKDIRDMIDFGVANGSTAAQTLARSILSTNIRPVILVIDTDTTDDRRIAELREMVEYGLREASSGTPYKLCLAIPTIEASLVQDERVFDYLFGDHKVQPFELDYARQNPKQYLQQQFHCGPDYASCLSGALAKFPPDSSFLDVPKGLPKEIADFVHSVSERAA